MSPTPKKDKDHKESYGPLLKGCVRLTNPLVNA